MTLGVGSTVRNAGRLECSKAVGKNALKKDFSAQQIVSKARLVRKKFTKLGYNIPEIPRKESSTALLSDSTIKSLAAELGLKKL